MNKIITRRSTLGRDSNPRPLNKDFLKVLQIYGYILDILKRIMVR